MDAAHYRRLTVRERASLQGFPITYQFYARSFAEKVKMIGNAIPPTFTYLVACAAQGVQINEFLSFAAVGRDLRVPRKAAPVTVPDSEGRAYSRKRGFRAALPGLRFKSGMRFDLSNQMDNGDAQWRIRFFFGPSKAVREINLDGSMMHRLRRELAAPEFSEMRGRLVRAEAELAKTSPQSLQDRWTRRVAGLGPFEVVDLLGELAAELMELLMVAMPSRAAGFVREIAATAPGEGPTPGVGKLERYAVPVLAGLVIGDWFNTLAWHSSRKAAA